MILFSYIIKELFNDRRFSLLFIINLTLGLVGFVALDGFRDSIDKTLYTKSKAILGADFGLSSRRPLKSEELNFVTKNYENDHSPLLKQGSLLKQSPLLKTNMVEMFSMVASQQGISRLIQIKAIEKGFPFYGKLELEKNKFADTKDFQALYDRPVAWVYPELLTQLQINIGDRIQIGEGEFEVAHAVSNDSAAGFTTNMAPRIYIGLSQIHKTDLLKPGSLAWYSTLFKMPISPRQINELKQKVFQAIDNPDVQVYTHKNVSQQMARLLSYLNDFLGLSSLVALFLASMGTGFLFRSYLRRKIKEIAILISLGVSHRQAFFLYLLQVVTLGFVSSLLAGALSWGILPILNFVTKGLLPFPIEFSVHPSSLLMGALIGTLGCVCSCLPMLMQLRGLKPSLLFTQVVQPSPHTWIYFVAFLPGAFLFWYLSVWLSHSWRMGSLFIGLFFGAGLILTLSAWLVFKLLGTCEPSKILSLRWALRHLTRNPLSTLSSFLSIAMGMVLLNLIPQIRHSLQIELQSPEKSKLPSLFLFDIQEEQLPEIKKFLQDESLKFQKISPLVRARLKSVNGVAFSKSMGAKDDQRMSLEEEREMRARNRGYNLSYRNDLIQSEKIIRGKPFSGIYEAKTSLAPTDSKSMNSKDMDSQRERSVKDSNLHEIGIRFPEISLEKRFARRLNLNIGDTMTFDIQSALVMGKVINIRSVQWTSFQPNFFIQFQPGVLTSAPKTFLGTLPPLVASLKTNLQNKIVGKFPNVSIVDVSRIVHRLKDITNQITWALQFMTALSLMTGFMVIFLITHYQAQSRRRDMGLLKVLGARFQDIRYQFLWQLGIISLLASLLGLAVGLLVSFLISKILFESFWAYEPITPMISLIVCVLSTLLITELATRGALATKAKELL